MAKNGDCALLPIRFENVYVALDQFERLTVKINENELLRTPTESFQPEGTCAGIEVQNTPAGKGGSKNVEQCLTGSVRCWSNVL
jgi:hypothetical protein